MQRRGRIRVDADRQREPATGSRRQRRHAEHGHSAARRRRDSDRNCRRRYARRRHTDRPRRPVKEFRPVDFVQPVAFQRTTAPGAGRRVCFDRILVLQAAHTSQHTVHRRRVVVETAVRGRARRAAAVRGLATSTRRPHPSRSGRLRARTEPSALHRDAGTPRARGSGCCVPVRRPRTRGTAATCNRSSRSYRLPRSCAAS